MLMQTSARPPRDCGVEIKAVNRSELTSPRLRCWRRLIRDTRNSSRLWHVINFDSETINFRWRAEIPVAHYFSVPGFPRTRSEPLEVRRGVVLITASFYVQRRSTHCRVVLRAASFYVQRRFHHGVVLLAVSFYSLPRVMRFHAFTTATISTREPNAAAPKYLPASFRASISRPRG